MSEQTDRSASGPDCCQNPAPTQEQRDRTADRLGRWSTPAAVGSAILSSACCWLPLLLLAFGVSAGGVAGFFESVRAYFLIVAGIFLAAGFYAAYVRKPACHPGEACATPNPKFRRFNRAMLWVATVFVVGFALFPYYSPALIRAFGAPGGGGEPAAVDGGQAGAGDSEDLDGAAANVERRFAIADMTCRACAATLELRLARLPGVVEANVTYETETAVIRAAPDGPSDAAIAEAVRSAGFSVKE